MADVLIVCVREDEPRAKALAEMFEAAGFSIGGAPSTDAALRSSGAGVVVWSQAAIRSRPFLDAAQRVINADKAVVASLIEPPPPSSVGNSPSFDLSDWNGDPNDSALDPLFFAVDRMVNSQRASVGADTAPPPAYERPTTYDPPQPRQPAPPPRATPPAPRPTAPPRSTSRDAQQSESEHWRAIRDSRDPADFMDFLARYGAGGDFAELAELRLKQLTSAAPGAERPQVRPTVRPETPIAQREAAPVRNELPSSLRREPARRMDEPPRRLDPPPRSAPSYDRSPRQPFDRYETREPTPRQSGGALRAILLLAVLGGIALAGGLYFGPTLAGNNDAAQEQSQEATTTSDSASTGDEPATSTSSDSGSGSSLSDLTAPSTVAPASRRQPDTTRPEPQQPSRQAAASRQAAPQSTPPRSSFAANNTNSGGPVSLTSPSTPPNSGPVSLVNPQPQTQEPPPAISTMVAAAPASQPPAAAARGLVQFSSRPSPRRIAELFPERATRANVGGRAVLDCVVAPTLTLNCAITSETPTGLGFGRAALSAAASYRALPLLTDGGNAVGAPAHLVVQFQNPQ